MLAIYDSHNHSNVLAEGPRSPRHSHPDCSEFYVSLHDEILERYGSAFSHLLPHYAKTYTFEKRPRCDTNLGLHAQPILPILNDSKRPLFFNSTRNCSSCRRELNLLSFVVNVPWISRCFSIRYQPCPSLKDRLSRASNLMGLMPLPYLAV